MRLLCASILLLSGCIKNSYLKCEHVEGYLPYRDGDLSAAGARCGASIGLDASNTPAIDGTVWTLSFFLDGPSYLEIRPDDGGTLTPAVFIDFGEDGPQLGDRFEHPEISGTGCYLPQWEDVGCVDQANLTAGFVEVVREGPEDQGGFGDIWRLEWDLEFGDPESVGPQGAWWHLSGEDWVGF